MVQTQDQLQAAHQSGRLREMWMYVKDLDCPIFIHLRPNHNSKRVELWPLSVEYFASTETSS